MTHVFPRHACGAWRRPILALALVMTFPAASLNAQVTGAVQVESSPSGDLMLDARGAQLAQVLHSIAAMEGFDVVMDERIPRRPVHVSDSRGPLEEVLRQILRGRNFALIYDEETAALAQVIVLRPSTPRRPSLTSRSRRANTVRRR